MTPIATPFLFNGVSERAMEGLAPALARAGLVPAQGGTTSRSSTTTPGAESKIVPGAGVGMKLVRGDVEFAAICTVTYRDKDKVMACGHPLLNLGPTDLIMTTAQVNGLFPSLQESFKFASAGEEVGAFRQDRATGVFGYLGKRPRLIPVRLELQPQMGRPQHFAFDVVEDPFLAPYLLRSEEHTSELQSRLHLVCRLLLEKKKWKGSTPAVSQPRTKHLRNDA